MFGNKDKVRASIGSANTDRGEEDDNTIKVAHTEAKVNA